MSYQPKPGSHAETLVNAIRKHAAPIRSPELARLAGVDANSITTLLKTALDAGLVSCCKVTVASRPPTNEWRPGPGMPRLGGATLKSTSLGRPVIPVRESISGAQPAVAPPQKTAVSNTGSPRGEPSSVRPAAPPARAVASKPPQARPRPVSDPAAGDDTAMLERIQAMPEADFIDYMNHLARVWSWGRARHLVNAALQNQGA